MSMSHNGHDPSHSEHDEQLAAGAPEGQENGGLNKTVATVVIVGAAAALFEAALLPGIVIGVAGNHHPRIAWWRHVDGRRHAYPK